MKIEGKVALVTGGASGIGRGLAQRLLENGIKFLALIDCAQEEAIKTIDELSDKFGADRVKFIHCDVTDEPQLRKSFQEAYDVHKALDIVVNNAGILSKDHLKTINVNLIAVLNGMLIANDLMTKTKRTEKGVIINTSSYAGLMAMPKINIGYTASKHGVIGLTKAFQCGSDGFSEDLRAVAICPAGVDTVLNTRNGFLTTKEGVEDWEKTLVQKNLLLSMSSAVDAYIQAIEDDTLSGAIIKAEPHGNTIIYD